MINKLILIFCIVALIGSRIKFMIDNHEEYERQYQNWLKGDR